MGAERAVTAPQQMATATQSSEQLLQELQVALVHCCVCCCSNGTGAEDGAFSGVSNVGRRVVVCVNCIVAFAGSYCRDGDAAAK